MKRIPKFGEFIFIVCVIIFVSCEKFDSQTQLPSLHAPIARAGSDHVINSAPDSIILDGSASTSIDGNIVSYEWSRFSGPPDVLITNSSTAITVIKSVIPGPLHSGIWEFKLKVTSSNRLSSTDYVIVSVNELPPQVDTTGGFIFQNLYWELDTLDWPPPGIVTAVVDPSQFFTIASMSSRQVQVFIQLGSSQDWIYVPGWDWYGNYNPPPPNYGYVWYFASYPYAANPNFFIESTPTNYQLVGNTLKVKVKLL